MLGKNLQSSILPYVHHRTGPILVLLFWNCIQTNQNVSHSREKKREEKEKKMDVFKSALISRFTSYYKPTKFF